MFIELTDAIRGNLISINTEKVEAFYDVEDAIFSDDEEFIGVMFNEGELPIKTVVEVSCGRLYVEESYEEIRSLLKVHGMYK